MTKGGSVAQSFGSRLKYLRVLKGMTQAELAARVGLSVTHVGRVERGEALPSFSLIQDLALALETPPLNFFLLFDRTPPTSNAIIPSPTNESRMPSGKQFCFMARLATWVMGGPNLKPFWSESLYILLGYAPFSVKPTIKRFLRHVHPSQQEATAGYLEMATQRRADSGMLVDIVTRQDQERKLMLNPDTFRPSPDDPTATQLIIQDVTDCVVLNQAVGLRQEELEAYVVRKNQDLAEVAEKYKQEAEQRRQAEKGLRIFEQMVDSSHDAQAFVDADGVIVAVNRAHEKLSGMSAADIEGRQWAEFLIDYWGQEFFDQTLKSRIEKALQLGQPAFFQEWRTYRNGKRKYVHVIYTPCHKNGDVAGVVVTIHDLTYFMEIHERLEERERLHRQILETANEGIVMVDEEQRITFVNQKIEALFGYTPEEVVDTFALAYFHPEDLDRAATQAAKNREGNHVRHLLRLIHKDGRAIWTLHSATPLLDSKKNFRGSLIMIMDVTELKNTEAALERKTLELESLLENLPLGVVAWDGAGNLLKSNNEFHEMTGYPPGRIRTLEDWFPLAYPDEKQRKEVIENWKQTTREAAEAIREYPVTCANGMVKHVEFRGNFFANNCSFITMADVTQRKLAEQARLDSEERFRLLFQNAPMPYQSLDEKGNFLDINQAFLDVLGYSREELIGKNFSDILPPGWKDHFKENFPKFKAVGEILGVEFEMIKQDGSTILVFFNGKIQKDGQGRFQRTHCIFQDVSEQRRTEQALRESREEFKTLAEKCPISIMRFDHQGRVTFVNDWHMNVFAQGKLEKSFFLGKLIHELPGLVKAGVAGEAAKILKGECIELGEVFFPEFSGGGCGWASIRGVPLIHEGKVAGGILIREDISQRKLAEQALEKSREELKALLADKDKFFSIIAHDLRSPLSGLLGLAEMMGRDDGGLSPKELRNIAKIMGKTVGDLFALLENLLDWSRMQRGLTAFEPVPCVLREVIAANIGLLRPWAIQKEVVLSNTVASKLVVSADQAMLNTVIRNLLSNALKFTERGGTVNIRAVEANADVTVAVQDSGVGMDRETMEGIFSMTRKTRNRGTEGESGSGLGLLLCKEFVERHGGRIWAESAPGLGSTFFFTLSQDKIREA
ncbi:PAS domain S-box-containing protein [Desulfonatronum zhilinae]|nr:PAS domain S-box-containing protein [Desulfonatronum zhilinae]